MDIYHVRCYVLRKYRGSGIHHCLDVIYEVAPGQTSFRGMDWWARPHHSLTERYKWLAASLSWIVCCWGLGSLPDHFCECLVSAESSVALWQCPDKHWQTMEKLNVWQAPTRHWLLERFTGPGVYDGHLQQFVTHDHKPWSGLMCMTVLLRFVLCQKERSMTDLCKGSNSHEETIGCYTACRHHAGAQQDSNHFEPNPDFLEVFHVRHRTSSKLDPWHMTRWSWW